MAKYHVTKRSAVILFIAFLLAATLVGLLCGLLPTCEIEPVVPEPQKQAWENTRLPLTLSPVSYDLLVRTDLTNFVFSGSVEVLFECLDSTELILIHGKNLVVGEGRTTLKRDGGGTAPELLKEPWIYEENQFIVIELDGTLKKGDMYRLYIEFEGPLLDDLLGYYRMSYTTAAGEKRFLASTFFDPVDARKAFPCFDEPAMKATFTITLEHEPKYHALANSAKSGDDEVLSDGWIRATFKETVKMSSYLVCYVVSDFKAKFTTTANGVIFGVWAREDYINQTDYALEKGAAVLDYFDGLYGEGVVYPMEKMDMIALPDFTAGAMENWGLITYRDTALLYEDGVSSESQKQRVCAIVAHELAHQWFGNLVTMQWWDHLWLNEGFASYVEYVGTVEVEPDWGMWDKFILYDLHRAMATDARVTSRPIINEVETPAEINSMFDRISYQKGSSVLRMMSTFLGDETFVKGLKYYLDAKQYGNAVNSDLWLHIDTAMKEDNINLGDGMDIATVMKTWMHQMGFPVIKVERDYTGNGQITARVEQKRFLSDPTADTKTDYDDLGYVWYVPLTYTTSNSPEFESPDSKWIRPEDEFVSIETPGSNTDWLLLNIDQKGIYRVNYDDQNWELIKAQLESNHKAISTASRASLISDAFSLAEASEISQSKAFDMTTYLKEERDFVPWYAVDGALSNTEKNLQRKGAFGNFQKYMRGQVTPMYEFVGWENTGDHLTRMSRGGAVSMACRYGNEDCIETSVNYYSQWMTNQDEIVVHPDMQATAYCSAIAAGGQDEWNFAFDVYTGANTPASVKARLLTAMACSKKPWILNTYLSYILDTSIIRAQDAADVITAVAGNPVGLPLAWDFFRGNWEFFRTGYGDTVFLLDSIISGITSYFNTPFELESLERFMADNPDQGTGARAFTEAVAVVKGNIRWIEQNYEDVDQWLQAAVTETKAWMDIRLPHTLMPEHYDLMVRTDLTNFVFSGSIKILIHCDMKTDVILVHSKYLNITEGVTTLVHADGGKAPTISKEPWLYKENEFLVVELNSYLTPGEKYNLYLEFVGPLDERLSGFYRSSYTTKLGEERHLANTFFDPIYARFAFPCFDEPDMKATFTITLENEPMYHALANTPQVGDDEVLSDGWIRATFEETVKMPTYLVCYVISDFKAKFTTTANGVKFGVWAQEDFINQTDYALEKGAAILDYFDNLYGLDIKYPLAKLDMVALPAFSAGAMENWGLVTYRESTLLYEEGVSTASRQQRVCTIIAHELAHQWFGNLVTMKWWDQLWLNEGITSYMEYVGTAEVEQDWAMWDKFVVYDLKSAMGVDDEVGSRPIVSPANTPEEIDGMFDTITYQKGASVTRMMNNFLGESTFLKGIKNYLVARQYDTAENSDLWFHLQAAADEDGIDFGDGITMETIMKPWVRQSGFPVVTVTRRYTGEEKITILASQKRFLADPALDTPSSKYEDFGYEWYVPLTYITSANPSFNQPDYKWMVPMEDVTMIERSDIGGDTDWLLMNIDQQGVYRVNYDDANWKLLATQLRNDHQVISPASRAALINDAFFLASSDDLDEVIALEMTSYLKEERDYVPWYMVDTNVGYDYDQLALTEANATFEAYIKGQVEPMYKYIGWGDGGGNLRRLSRTRIVRMACQYRIENCTTTARNQYQQWMADSSFYLYPDLQPTVLCTGIAEGNQAQWDYAFEVFKDPDTDSTLKSDIRSALACSRDQATLSMYLNEILNTSVISESDGRSVLTTVASKPAGRELAWDFYTSNLEYFIKTYGDSVSQYSSIISAVTSDFNTQEKLDEVFKD
ncbi:uncharacterized protein LOC117296681 [Asterias rubens]|uniref:uncharacterized protein LOC117296681 n=1 Tax=Asterias rubens TaxID=7604 RepID=UPI0014552342|nr:uncharacterized protein LOC117296681 [Asterias rubens]